MVGAWIGGDGLCFVNGYKKKHGAAVLAGREEVVVVGTTERERERKERCE